jgi:hypothetical protein
MIEALEKIIVDCIDVAYWKARALQIAREIPWRRDPWRPTSWYIDPQRRQS